MTPHELERQLSRGTLLPVYVIYGEEDYFVEGVIRSLVARGLGDGDPSFNVTTVQGSDGDSKELAKDITSTCLMFPFMSDKRVVVVKDADKIAGREPLSDYIQNPQESTVLILVLSAPPPRSKKKVTTVKKGGAFDFFTYLRTHPSGDHCVECKRLSEADAMNWIRNRFSEAGRVIDDKAAALIPTLQGTGLRAIDQEIQKILVALPEVTRIRAEDIEAYFATTRQFTMFDLSNAILRKQRVHALRIAEQGFDLGSLPGLVSYLTTQYTALWKMWRHPVSGRVSDEQAREVGLGFAWQYEALRPALQHLVGMKDIQSRFEALLAADLGFKSGKDHAMLLTTLIHLLTA